MLKTTLKSSWSRRRRLLSTGFAIVLGVAFLAATLVLGDTARAGFSAAFSEANAGIDTYVRSAQEFTGGEETIVAPLDGSIVATISSLDVVDHAVGSIEGYAQVLDADGDPIGGEGPPTLGGNWIADARLTGWRIAEGRAPSGDDEVVLDRSTFETADVAVGDEVTILVPDPTPFTVVGVATFGDDDSLGPSTFAAFTDAAARAMFVRGDQVSAVVVAGVDGVGADEVTSAVAAVAPAGAVVMTGAERTAEMEEEIESDFLGFMTMGLTIFAGIALLVAAFSIYNTFSIIVAQRTRESALLRAVGATRRQVLASTLVESVLVGLVGSAVGVVAGVALGAGMLALISAAGFGLPGDGLAVSTGTVAVSVIAGLAVTVTGGLAPAWRASGVAPLAALRDVAVDDSDTSRVRIGVGGATATAGAALLVFAGAGVVVAGAGAVAVLVGVLLLGPVVARPVAGVLGRPLRLRGVPGELARRNAIRNPRRTASTASALVIGVGIVSLFTIFGASIQSSISEEVSHVFAGDLMVGSAGFGGTDVTAAMVAEIDALDSVDDAAGLGFGPATVDGRQEGVQFTSDAAAQDRVAIMDVAAGSLEQLDATSVAVSQDYADEHGYSVGDRVVVGFIGGDHAELRVVAVYGSESLTGPVLVDGSLWRAQNPQAGYDLVLVGLRDGADIGNARAAVSAIVDTGGGIDVQDRDEFIESAAAEIDVLLSVVYGLLAMAIVIALMGIANTMSLSIHERVRELGLLRAVGLTREQLRSTVRWESVLVSTFGAIGGLGLGLFLSWGLVSALVESEGFGRYDVPVGSLFVILALGAGAGLLAGVRPARRAARLDVLDAIGSE